MSCSISTLAQKIRFDRELRRGIISYNEKVGWWWFRQASNPIHAYAYRNIADFIHASCSRHPSVIVDYACGSGNLLSLLCERFPGSRLEGMDGSSLLLGLARRRLARKESRRWRNVDLIETLLPDFELPMAVTDLVVFAFPNMVPSRGDEKDCPSEHLSPTDLSIARVLARRRDSVSVRGRDDPQTAYASLLRERLVSLNIHGLLKQGGLCVRVEYANVPRQELPRLELLRTGFEEGSLDLSVDGKTPDQWFRVLASRYYRSGVMEDVYHQSGDKCNRRGGYFINVLRAL